MNYISFTLILILLSVSYVQSQTCSIIKYSDSACSTEISTSQVNAGACEGSSLDYFMANSIGNDEVILEKHTSGCGSGNSSRAVGKKGSCLSVDGKFYSVVCPSPSSSKYAVLGTENVGNIYVSNICTKKEKFGSPITYVKYDCIGDALVEKSYSDDKCANENQVQLLYSEAGIKCQDTLPANAFIQFEDQSEGCNYRSYAVYAKLDVCHDAVYFKYTVEGSDVVRRVYSLAQCKNLIVQDEFPIERCVDESSIDPLSHYVITTSSSGAFDGSLFKTASFALALMMVALLFNL